MNYTPVFHNYALCKIILSIISVDIFCLYVYNTYGKAQGWIKYTYLNFCVVKTNKSYIAGTFKKTLKRIKFNIP